MDIVSVQFRKQTKDSAPAEYGGREYTYFSEVPLSEGQALMVPTKSGETAARVLKIGLSKSHIDERVMPFMKTIREIVRPEDRQQTSGVNPLI